MKILCIRFMSDDKFYLLHMKISWQHHLCNPSHVLLWSDVNLWNIIRRILIQHYGDVSSILASTHVLLVWTLKACTVQCKDINAVRNKQCLHQREYVCSCHSWTIHILSSASLATWEQQILIFQLEWNLRVPPGQLAAPTMKYNCYQSRSASTVVME